MQLDSEDLLARMARDWPTEFELSRLRVLTEVQATRIQELEAQQPTSYSASAARPYVTALDDQDARRG